MRFENEKIERAEVERIRGDLTSITKYANQINRTLNKLVLAKIEHICPNAKNYTSCTKCGKGCCVDNACKCSAEEKYGYTGTDQGSTVNNYRCTDKDTGISLEVWQNADGALYSQVKGQNLRLLGYQGKLDLDMLRDLCKQELNTYLASLDVKSPPPHQDKADPTEGTDWRYLAEHYKSRYTKEAESKDYVCKNYDNTINHLLDLLEVKESTIKKQEEQIKAQKVSFINSESSWKKIAEGRKKTIDTLTDQLSAKYEPK